MDPSARLSLGKGVTCLCDLALSEEWAHKGCRLCAPGLDDASDGQGPNVGAYLRDREGGFALVATRDIAKGEEVSAVACC